jgi:FtsH-binding integral membrane protein
MAGEEAALIGLFSGSLICAYYSGLINDKQILTKLVYWILAQALLVIGLFSIWFYMPTATFGTFKPVVVVLVVIGVLLLFLVQLADILLKASEWFAQKIPTFITKVK